MCPSLNQPGPNSGDFILTTNFRDSHGSGWMRQHVAQLSAYIHAPTTLWLDDSAAMKKAALNTTPSVIHQIQDIDHRHHHELTHLGHYQRRPPGDGVCLQQPTSRQGPRGANGLSEQAHLGAGQTRGWGGAGSLSGYREICPGWDGNGRQGPSGASGGMSVELA